MVGAVSFRLDAPDGLAGNAGANPHPGEGGLPPEGNDQTAAGATVPVTPQLLFASDPGSYTQLWTSQSSATTAQEMRDDMESYLVAFAEANPDYPTISTAILNSSDWMGFLTVLPNNQVVLVHSLGLFSSGLGRATPAHNRIFGLIGERVGTGLPPIVMVPSAGLVPWIKIQTHPEPTKEALEVLETTERRTISAPEEDDDNAMSVQNICFVPKAWAAYFLAPMSPWNALKVYRWLLETIPAALRPGFDFLGSWIAVACTSGPTDQESKLKAKWQSPPAERRMIAWMQRRTLYLNAVPATEFNGGGPGMALNPQECFNKALETVAALRPPSEATAAKKYTPAELERLRAACSLTAPEMETALPPFHEQLLTEGRTKKGTEAVLRKPCDPTRTWMIQGWYTSPRSWLAT